MSIIQGNEPDTTVIGNTPIGLYYYFIDKTRISINKPSYLGYAPTIESVTYNPFIDENDISLIESNFDVDRFGYPDGEIPKCYRIISDIEITKILGSLELFPLKDTLSPNTPLKMYCYPFRYFLITDYINAPILIKPELVINNNVLEIKVTTTALTQQGKYNIWVNGYKRDNVGNLEGTVNSLSFMLPVASSAYSQFLATSSAQYEQSLSNSLLENDMTLRHGSQQNKYNLDRNNASNISSIASLNLGMILNAGVNLYQDRKGYNLNQQQLSESTQLNEYEIVSMSNAKITDTLSTPRTLKTSGNDTLFNIVNSRGKIDVIEYQSTYFNKVRIRDYFNRYGYSVNRYEPISLNTRKHFDFIKTNICNITGANIPQKYLSEIKDIFNKGITFWHMDNNTTMFDYEIQNNAEV